MQQPRLANTNCDTPEALSSLSHIPVNTLMSITMVVTPRLQEVSALELPDLATQRYTRETPQSLQV
jgi:hypothetical protein